VFEDSKAHYEDISNSVKKIEKHYWATLAGGADLSPSYVPTSHLFFNPNPFSFDGFVSLGTTQKRVSLQPYSIQYLQVEKKPEELEESERVTAKGVNQDLFVLENSKVLAQFDRFGRLLRFYDKLHAREVLESGAFGNTFRFYEDIPLFWDAWDVEVYHLEKGWDVNALDPSSSPKVDPTSGPALGKLQFTLKLSESSDMVCTASLSADSALLQFECSVNWNENRRFLVRLPFLLSSKTNGIVDNLLFGPMTESGVPPEHSLRSCHI